MTSAKKRTDVKKGDHEIKKYFFAYTYICYSLLYMRTIGIFRLVIFKDHRSSISLICIYIVVLICIF